MKLVLIGDSIRVGYELLVVKKFKEDGVEVWAPTPNSRHSLWALDHFQEWVADQKPDIVHVNFGIHDASIQPDGNHQVILSQYKLCLQRFINKVVALGGTRMIWATSTPLYVPREGVPMAGWEPYQEAEIAKYNAAALEIVCSRGIPVNDLHAVVMRNGFHRCLDKDGCHMTEFGNEVLSHAVIEAVRRLMQPPVRKEPFAASGP